MVGRRPRISWFLVLLVACAIGSAAVPARAERLDLQGQIETLWWTLASQERPSFRDRVFGRGGQRNEVAVARISSGGGPTFILDQSNPSRPLLKYEQSSEIWALRPSAGIRGDIYYRNDIGEVVLRATRMGGLTLYTSSAPGGLPCAVEGEAGRLEVARHDVRSLFRHMLREAARGGQALHGQLEIRAQDVEPATDDLYGDTATVAVDGIVRLSQSRNGRDRLAGLRILSIVEGMGANVQRDGDTLIVTIAPSQGLAGRPSSARVMRALR